MEDETVLKDVIHDIAKMTGREVSKEQEEKIISTVKSGKVPENLDKYLQ